MKKITIHQSIDQGQAIDFIVTPVAELVIQNNSKLVHVHSLKLANNG